MRFFNEIFDEKINILQEIFKLFTLILIKNHKFLQIYAGRLIGLKEFMPHSFLRILPVKQSITSSC